MILVQVSQVWYLGMFSGMPKLSLNDLNYQYSVHMSHQ